MILSEELLHNILEEVCQNKDTKKTCKKLDDEINRNGKTKTSAESKKNSEKSTDENRELAHSTLTNADKNYGNDSKDSLTKLKQKSKEKKTKHRVFRKFIKSMLENENEEELKLELKEALKNEEFQKYIRKLKNKYRQKTVSEEFGKNKSANSNRLKKQKNLKKSRLTPNDQELVRCYKDHKKMKSCIKNMKKSTLNNERKVDHSYLNYPVTPYHAPHEENFNNCFSRSAERFSRMLEDVKNKGSVLFKSDIMANVYERSFDSEKSFNSLRNENFPESLSLKENSSIIINFRRMEMQKTLYDFKNNNIINYPEIKQEKTVKLASPRERPFCSDVKSQMANNSNRFSLPSRGNFEERSSCGLSTLKAVHHTRNEALDQDILRYFDKDFNFTKSFNCEKRSCNKEPRFEKNVNFDNGFDVCKKCGKRRGCIKSDGCATDRSFFKDFNTFVSECNSIDDCGDEWQVKGRSHFNVNNCGYCSSSCDCCCCCPYYCCCCPPPPPKTKRLFRWRRCRQPCFLGEPCEVVADHNHSNKCYFNESPERSFFSSGDLPF